ncbi:RecQ type DNA helicase [Schizosaccharomyces pombe]
MFTTYYVTPTKIINRINKTEGRAQDYAAISKTEILFKPVNSAYPHVSDHVNGLYKFSLDDLKRLYQSMFSKLQSIFHDLIFTIDVEKLIPLSILTSIKDDLNNTKNNYSIFKHCVELQKCGSTIFRTILINGELRTKYLPTVTQANIQQVVKENQNRLQFVPKQLPWCVPALNQYRQLASQFNELLYLLITISAGQPARSQEQSYWTFQNSKDSVRQLFVYLGRLMIFSHYDKTRNKFFAEKPIARFLPVSLSIVALRYYAMVRPFEILIESLITQDVQGTTACKNYEPTKKV